MIALRGQSTWRVFIIHVLFWAFADAYKKRGDREHATLLFCARECRERQRSKGSKE